jgi:predicted CXXCH cytochrome family protein
MFKRLKILAGLIPLALLVLARRADAASSTAQVERAPIRRGAAVAPLPKDRATRSHVPYESGQCGVCHQNNDAANPGPIPHATVNEVCFECHEDVRDVMARKYRHVPAEEACTDCHNPHDSSEPALLSAGMVELCTRCHAGIGDQLANGKVQHGAVSKDRKCSNCHDPHAANVERLLVADYPAGLYARYERTRYALCFGCHNEKVASVAKTRTLTGFRDGSRNLHYVHVNRAHGRTCRACHEVHASRQDLHPREGAPSAKGWVVELGYTKLPNGGSCAKTCHDARTYENKSLTRSAPVKK